MVAVSDSDEVAVVGVNGSFSHNCQGEHNLSQLKLAALL